MSENKRPDDWPPFQDEPYWPPLGYEWMDGDSDDEDDYTPSTCPHCNGTGIDVWTGLEDCEYCDGYGYKWWE